MLAISIQKLTKKYDDLTVVDGIDLSVEQGEIFGLLGPNGAGKTTTLMMLSTLLDATSGSATINGFDIKTQKGKVRGSIGMVFQDPSTDEILTGYENLKLHALMYDVPAEEIGERIDSVLKLVDLQDRQHEIVKKYSGGMRRRLEIARGLLHQPEILFLDEPTLGLDPQTREHIWAYIEALAKKSGMTIILTTHYMEEADKLCDRVAIIDHGKIVVLDTPEKLRHAMGGDSVLLSGKDLPLEAIRQLPFVQKLEKIDHHIKLSIADSAKNLSELLRVAGEIDLVEVRSPDLNDVFLHFTGNEIREEGGGAMEHLRAITRARQNR